MFKNLIRYSFKSFKRQRAYVVINVLGLSIGIASSLIIAFFVLHETSYDSFNTRKDRIYNLVLNFRIGGQEFKDASSPAPQGPAMLKEFPEIENFLRMMKMGWIKTVNSNNLNFSVDQIIEADTSFFSFFSVPVLKGDSRNLLNAPRKVVLSETTARKIFGRENPIDKTLRLGKDTVLYTVTGVMADMPGNSHFEADILVSFMSDRQANSPEWTNNRLSTYLLLKPNTGPETVNDKMPGLVIKYIGPELQRILNLSFDEFLSKGNKYGYSLQKLTDIHLDTAIETRFKPAGDPRFLKILSSIAILILIIAIINFTNLSTAQASRRAKEVGIKKVGGSSRGILILQFISESIILTSISTIIGLILIKVIEPYFNKLLDAKLHVDILSAWYVIPSLLIFSIVVGILAGIYPAFVLSSFNPYEVICGGAKMALHSGRLRRVLVVFQFTVSIVLIVGTIVMYRQIKFMLNKDSGFNKDQLIVLENAEALGTRAQSFKDAVRTIPAVLNVAGSSFVPGRANNNNGYMLEGNKDETILLWTGWIDYDFIETYEMTMLQGRTFNEQYPGDKHSCIVNEAAILKFNIDPEKKRIMEYRDSGKVDYLPIVGVVKDFVFESLRNRVGPYIFRFKPNDEFYTYLTLKINSSDYRATISEIEKKWRMFTTDEPFKFYFINEVLQQLYIHDKQNGRMAIISSVLAIFVAVLGLFGLTSFSVEQRTKEIGVRKSMGSSVKGIYFIISREVMILILISALIAFPLVYYLSGKWLESFYYKINIGIFSFVSGLIIAFGIAILTISYRVIRAARVNPAQSLKYE